MEFTTRGMQEHEVEENGKEKLISQLFGIASDTTITFTRITTGITNVLYKCEWHPNGCCLLRIYGKNTESFINRADEITVMKYLSEEFDWFPPVFATFPWGIVYGFSPGIPLTPDQLGKSAMAKQIAEFLACWHKNVRIGGLRSTASNNPSLLNSLTFLYNSGK